jgi:hypothetical protein
VGKGRERGYNSCAEVCGQWETRSGQTTGGQVNRPMPNRLTDRARRARVARRSVPMELTWRHRNRLVAGRWTGCVVVKLHHKHQVELYQDCRPDAEDAPQPWSIRVGSASHQANLYSTLTLTNLRILKLIKEANSLVQMRISCRGLHETYTCKTSPSRATIL